MVVVCGNNMGDIFRRNAFNLGLHVVQSPEAVADAKDGDAFTFDPDTRRLAQRDAGQGVRPGAAHGEGGRDPPQRRHLRRWAGASSASRCARRRASSGPTPATARRMTTTEQIVWAHRVDKDARDPRPARPCACTPTCCRPRDGTAPFSIHTFNQITGGNTIWPRQRRGRERPLRLHRRRVRRPADLDRPRVRASCTGSRSRSTPRQATASSTSTSPSRAWCSRA